MGITEEEFTAIATHLNDALETFDVPDNEREKVLEENTAWGFISVGENPEYAGLYITGTVGAVMSVARVREVVPVSEAPVSRSLASSTGD